MKTREKKDAKELIERKGEGHPLDLKTLLRKSGRNLGERFRAGGRRDAALFTADELRNLSRTKKIAEDL